MNPARSFKRLLRDLRQRVAARLAGTGAAIQRTGNDNVRERTIGYLSFSMLRRDRRFPDRLPGFRCWVAQNFLDEAFAAFGGPKLFFSSEPPPGLTRETREILDRPEMRPFTFLYSEPDVARRMFYPALKRVEPDLLERLEAEVLARRPGRCCLVNRWYAGTDLELTAQRVRFARALGEEIDIYGAEPWSGENGWRSFPRYRGAVADKRATVSQYDFIVAFENSDHFGYITEKVIDALVAGSIPLCWGGGGALADAIPADCIIDCRDRDPAEVGRQVVGMPHEEIVAYRRAGLRFLASPAARRFTRDHFVEQIIARLRAQGAGDA